MPYGAGRQAGPLVLDDKARADAEQSMAWMVEVIPTTLMHMYQALRKAGFSDEQAMQFLVGWFLALGKTG